MNSANYIKIGSAALAVGVGMLVGSYRSESNHSKTSATPPVAPGTVSGASARASAASFPGANLLQSVPRTIDDSEIEQIKAAKGARRWLLLLASAEKATAADMAALVRSVGKDSTAIRMLAARWAEIDPVHMFASIYADWALPEDSPGALPSRSRLASVLFEEWGKRDLATAVKVLNDAPEFADRESYRMTLARSALKVDVEQGLRLMKEWQIRGSIPDMKKVTEWATRDPQHAAKVVLDFGGDNAGQQALRAVGTAWAQSDPEGGLRFAANLDPAARATLGNELVQKWAERDPAGAAAFAASQDDMAYRAALGQGLVRTWAVSDPAKALAWSQEHLRGEARTEAVASVIRTYAETNLTAASQMVADMEPGGMQNRACASIFEAWFNKGPSEHNAAFEWLTSLPNQEAQQMALQRVQWNRVASDPAFMSNFLSGPHGALAPDYVVSQVAARQAMIDPAAAMKWASTLPGNRGSTARMGALSGWLAHNPEQAQAYALALPASSERQEAVRTISLNVASQSIERAAEWFHTLTAEDQQVATQAFQQIGFDDRQRRALEEAIKEQSR
jgi:hypothetical protein